jgi:DNA-binding NarL/FixJ family response regulator
MRTEAGASVNTIVAGLLARAEESANEVLGAARFKAEFDAGGRLSRREALALVLGEPAQAPPATPNGGQTSLLGNRQTDVARLVADGLTNKQIGMQLFISERTVESHVRNILNKLGVNSRAQIAAWIASSTHTRR